MKGTSNPEPCHPETTRTCSRVKDPPVETLILPSVEFQRMESMSQVPARQQEEAQREARQKKDEGKVGKRGGGRWLLLRCPRPCP